MKRGEDLDARLGQFKEWLTGDATASSVFCLGGGMAKKRVCRGEVKVVDPAAEGGDAGHPVGGLEVADSPVRVARTGNTGFMAGEVVLTSPTRDAGPKGLVLRKSPRPSGCSRFVRREIADAMPAICAMLLTRVIEQGDLSSLRVLLHMAVDGEREGLGRAGGFGRKILVGFKEWEARETGLRRES